MIENLKIDISPTPGKFQHLANDVLEFLLRNLQALDRLEQEIYGRHQVLASERPSPNQVHPGEDDLWDEYAQRCTEIIAPISVKPYTDTRSFGQPTKYEYLNDPGTTITVTVKSMNRAVVEALFESAIAKKEQFVLRKMEDSWKIDTKKYGYQDETTWYKDEL
ncbi:MAG: hypothetical protein JNM21_17025 [Taibaiella sp.]|nr:hypothetical protein [Taibaiella sp.]